MLRNKLKLNQDKTELFVISSKYRPRLPLGYIQIGDGVIKPSEYARNLGVTCDQSSDFREHIKMSWKSAYFRINSLAQDKAIFIPEHCRDYCSCFYTFAFRLLSWFTIWSPGLFN